MIRYIYCAHFRAVGNMYYGGQYKEKLVDVIRLSAEHCDCLQSFFILHSMGGGQFRYCKFSICCSFSVFVQKVLVLVLVLVRFEVVLVLVSILVTKR